MHRKLAEYLVEIDDHATLYEDYSGRFMYGERTTGVVTDSSLTRVLVLLVENADGLCSLTDEVSAEELVGEGLRMDQMGLGIVLY